MLLAKRPFDLLCLDMDLAKGCGSRKGSMQDNIEFGLLYTRGLLRVLAGFWLLCSIQVDIMGVSCSRDFVCQVTQVICEFWILRGYFLARNNLHHGCFQMGIDPS